MRNLSAALLTRAMGLVRALLTPARGRHSAAARRHRSTRVRRYAPQPVADTAPTPLPQATKPPARTSVPAPRPSAPRNSAPWLSPPRRALPAEDVALVRPYYAAHERELSRVQARATARLHGWASGTAPTAPAGDLLSPAPPDFDTLRTLWPDERARQRREVMA